MYDEWSDACTFLMGRRAHCRGRDTVHVNSDLGACFGDCSAEARVRKRTKIHMKSASKEYEEKLMHAPESAQAGGGDDNSNTAARLTAHALVHLREPVESALNAKKNESGPKRNGSINTMGSNKSSALEKAAAIIGAEVAKEALVFDGYNRRLERLGAVSRHKQHSRRGGNYLRESFSIELGRRNGVSVTLVTLGEFVEGVGHYARAGDREEDLVALPGVVDLGQLEELAAVVPAKVEVDPLALTGNLRREK